MPESSALFDSRLEVYTDFTVRLHECALYLSYSEMPDRWQRDLKGGDLKRFREARDELLLLLGKVRILGSRDTVGAADSVWDALVAWRTLPATGVATLSTPKWEEAYALFQKARNVFIDEARRELGID